MLLYFRENDESIIYDCAEMSFMIYLYDVRVNDNLHDSKY